MLPRPNRAATVPTVERKKMPVFDRNSIKTLVREIEQGTVLPVYLFCGDRYLCRQAADQVARALCADNGTVHPIDGDSEDINATIAKLRSFSLLPGRQVLRVNGTRLFLSKKVAKSLWSRAEKAKDDKPGRAAALLRSMMAAGGLAAGEDPTELSAAQWKKRFGFARPSGNLDWVGRLLRDTADAPAVEQPAAAGDPGQLLQDALEGGIPAGNTLLLIAEEADRRKKLFKFIKKQFALIDLAVESGSGARAKKGQQAVLLDLVRQSLEKMGKTMPPPVMEQLLERVGFHPVAVVMETEKLCLFVGDRSRITLEDLNAVVGRTRQDALFELTGAIGRRDLDAALLIAARLQENGIHPLAILATLRNFTRSLLLFRALGGQQRYQVRANMQAGVFQQQCLPLLKENEQWSKELSGHPYALYMQFKTALSFSLEELGSWLKTLLAAEMRLKGSRVDAGTVLQHLIISMLLKNSKGNLQNRHEALHYK